MLRSPAGAVLALSLASACAWGDSASAQEGVLSHFYGSGVHNYYERDYFAAMRELSTAIDGGTQDPRAYYYRGLANMRLGNSDAARRDMQRGADLESADVNQIYPVGRSLERVQGSQRLELERYRAVARAQAHQRRVERDAARYEQRRAAEDEVLRRVPLGPPPATLVPTPPAPAPAAEPTPPAVPPAAAPGDQPPAAPTPFDTEPAESPFGEEPTESPFGDEPAADEPAAEPAADNPFGGEAEMPAEDAADEPGDEENPFENP